MGQTQKIPLGATPDVSVTLKWDKTQKVLLGMTSGVCVTLKQDRPRRDTARYTYDTMATTTWTEQTKSSRLGWEQDTTGWMLICTVSSRLAGQIAVLVTRPQWLASTCPKTSHSMMSGEKHGQRTPFWGASSLVTHRHCRGQQLLFKWWVSPSSIRRRNMTPGVCVTLIMSLCTVSVISQTGGRYAEHLPVNEAEGQESLEGGMLNTSQWMRQKDRRSHWTTE